jgi:anaerobic magnesium-protoporphyrin IX monomethyl ester cyclase
LIYFALFGKGMKILLIQPPIEDFYQTSIRTQPLGLAYVAASLQAHGHRVEILDCQTEKKRPIPVPHELSYLRGFYPFEDRSPFKLYRGYYRFGMDREEIRRKIEGSDADVFGISSSFTPYHREALEIARTIKESDERKIVVMGGSHVSCDPAGVLRSPFVDYVVLGEGEIRLPLLLDRIEKRRGEGIGEMDGIGYRKEGRAVIHPLKTFIGDLDALPHPARELLDPDRYRMKKGRSTMVITSRGCPHGCAYCSSRLVMGPFFRVRTPETVLREMKECQDRYGIQSFDIEDDNFTLDRERAKRLMNLIIGAFGEGGIELTAMNGISFASLDEELLGLMKEAGFHTVNLSYVSSDPSTKERMGRPQPRIGFEEVLEGTKRAGLDVVAYAILGLPGQRIEEMVDTLIDLMGKRVLIGPSIYYPTPGTPLFERCKKDLLLPPRSSQWRSSAFPIETRDFSRLDLVTLFRLARVINFIKARMDKRELREGTTWDELFEVLKPKDGGKDQAEAKVEVKGGDEIAWVDLLALLIKERSFFSLRKESGHRMIAVKEESSRPVLDCFFERAWKRPILRSRHGV